MLHDGDFYFVLTRAFSSDLVETLYSNLRMGEGLHDATDAKTAHYPLQQILPSFVHAVSTTSTNVSANDASYTSFVGIIIKTL